MIVDPRECSQCLCLRSRRLAREITRIFDASLRPTGLRATQFSVLAMLAFRSGMSRNQIANELGLERTTLSRSLALMEKNGWIRIPASDDGRERPAELTRAGRAKLEDAYPAWRRAQREADRKFPGLRLN